MILNKATITADGLELFRALIPRLTRTSTFEQEAVGITATIEIPGTSPHWEGHVAAHYLHLPNDAAAQIRARDAWMQLSTIFAILRDNLSISEGEYERDDKKGWLIKDRPIVFIKIDGGVAEVEGSSCPMDVVLADYDNIGASGNRGEIESNFEPERATPYGRAGLLAVIAGERDDALAEFDKKNQAEEKTDA